MSDMICEMKFMDRDGLKDYVYTCLNVLYKDLITNPHFNKVEQRIHDLESDNWKIQAVRMEIERQLIESRNSKAKGVRVDQYWLARCKHALRAKAVQIQDNILEIRRLNEILKRNNQVLRDEQAIKEGRLFNAKIRSLLGSEEYLRIWEEINASCEREYPGTSAVKIKLIPGMDQMEEMSNKSLNDE